MTTTWFFEFLLKMLNYPVSVGVDLEIPSHWRCVLETGLHLVNGTLGTLLFRRLVCFKPNQRDLNVASGVTGQDTSPYWEHMTRSMFSWKWGLWKLLLTQSHPLVPLLPGQEAPCIKMPAGWLLSMDEDPRNETEGHRKWAPESKHPPRNQETTGNFALLKCHA